MLAPIAVPIPTIESRAYVIDASAERFAASNSSGSSPLFSAAVIVRS